MCGILGFIGKRAFSAEAFGSALDLMADRGPDDRGLFEEEDVLLGHRRLAILDLSPAGHQPMVSHDGRYVMVYNGEVYNFRALRAGMEKEGERFTSQSDSEVILELFARRGPACLELLRGMFALAIYDRREHALFMARDRLGIKPLYVWTFPGGLAFASETKALRALPSGPSRLHLPSVASYLAWGSVPGPSTTLDGVEALGPGAWARWTRAGMERGTYWSFPEDPPTYRTRGAALEVLRPALREAVAYRCIADVPIGAFLSGGVDSSALVSLMRDAGQNDLRTFSISFPGTSFDEASYALTAARRFGTNHTDTPMTAEGAGGEIEGFLGAMDQPTCDGFNVYLVSKAAKEGGLTVSLSGLGGDEVFAGYASFRRAVRYSKWVAACPPGLAGRAAGLTPAGSGLHRRLEVLGLRGDPVERLYAAGRCLALPSRLASLLAPHVFAAWSESIGRAVPGPRVSVPGRSPLHRNMALELSLYTHNQLLRDSDVFGMSRALEIRVPLLDHVLVETLFRTAPQVILDKGPKSLLLDALPEPLPAFCTHRPKMGFTFPFDPWMRGPWRKIIEDALLGVGARSPLLRPGAAERLWGDFCAGKAHWSAPWSLFVLLQHAAPLSSPA